MNDISIDAKSSVQSIGSRQQYYERIAKDHMTPLWEVLGSLVPKQPNSAAQPNLWRYADLREKVMQAGQLITAQEAERRVLILENPGLVGQSAITSSLYAGLQLILPGEIAPAHRHTQTALRLVLDGEGAYTAVNGERTTMHRGDFIITPAWTFHDHGNLGDQPVVWLDGLDIPTVRFYDAGFAEQGHSVSQETLRAQGDALARYGNNMVPVDFYQQPTEPTRLFVYPFARTQESLAAIASGTPDPHLGHKLRFVNPASGASPMPTMGAFCQRIPAGFETRDYQCTDGTVYVCLDGQATVCIANHEWLVQKDDIFVVPSWQKLKILALQETTLFSYSDRPAQQSLGLWREARH